MDSDWLIRILGTLVLVLSVFCVVLAVKFRQLKKEAEEYSEEDVLQILEAGQESGELKEEGAKMIDNILEFDDKLAHEIMTPRTDVFCIDANDPFEEYSDELMSMSHSRIPVYEDDVDNIIGVLHIKDFFKSAQTEGFENVDIRKVMRKPYFVPETKNIDSLFFELQKSKQHMAILIDEYGGFAGICTMEDIIEEVMGDIEDEFDEEDKGIVKIDDENYFVGGFVTLADLNDELGLEIESENIETIGGLVLELLGEIPHEGAKEKITVRYKNLSFEIEEFKDRRVELVKMHIGAKEEEDAKEE